MQLIQIYVQVVALYVPQSIKTVRSIDIKHDHSDHNLGIAFIPEQT